MPGARIVGEWRRRFGVEGPRKIVCIGLNYHDHAEEGALEHVAGYTIANDVSARDLQFRDGQWLRAKSFDTFCPLSPEIAPTGVGVFRTPPVALAPGDQVAIEIERVGLLENPVVA